MFPSTRYDIFWKDLFNPTEEFNRLFEDNKFHIPANIWYDADQLVIEVAATGIRDPWKSIGVKTEGDIIHFEYPVEKAAKDDIDTSGRTYIQKKISNRDFKFSLRINKSWDLEKTSASIKDGMLIVSIPKVEAAKLKSVDVKITK